MGYEPESQDKFELAHEAVGQSADQVELEYQPEYEFRYHKPELQFEHQPECQPECQRECQPEYQPDHQAECQAEHEAEYQTEYQAEHQPTELELSLAQVACDPPVVQSPVAEKLDVLPRVESKSRFNEVVAELHDVFEALADGQHPVEEQPAMDARHDMVEVSPPACETVATLPNCTVQEHVLDLGQFELPTAAVSEGESVDPPVFMETGEPVTLVDAVVEEVNSAASLPEPIMDEFIAPVSLRVEPGCAEAAKAFVGAAGPKAKGAAAPKAGAVPRAGPAPGTGAVPKVGAVTKTAAKPQGRSVSAPKAVPKVTGARAKTSAKPKAPIKARAMAHEVVHLSADQVTPEYQPEYQLEYQPRYQAEHQAESQAEHQVAETELSVAQVACDSPVVTNPVAEKLNSLSRVEPESVLDDVVPDASKALSDDQPLVEEELVLDARHDIVGAFPPDCDSVVLLSDFAVHEPALDLEPSTATVRVKEIVEAKGVAAPKAGAAPRGGAAPKAGATIRTGAAPKAGAVSKTVPKAPGANSVAVAKPKGKAVATSKAAPVTVKARSSAKTKVPTKAKAVAPQAMSTDKTKTVYQAEYQAESQAESQAETQTETRAESQAEHQLAE